MPEGVPAIENVLQTYHPALSGDRRRGQCALRAAQEQFSTEEIERHEEEDAALEQAEHEARLGRLMNVEEVIGADKLTDLDLDDSEYLPTPPRHAHDDEASVSAFGIDDSDVEPHVTVSSAPPQVTLVVVQQPSELTQIHRVLIESNQSMARAIQDQAAESRQNRDTLIMMQEQMKQ